MGSGRGYRGEGEEEYRLVWDDKEDVVGCRSNIGGSSPNKKCRLA